MWFFVFGKCCLELNLNYSVVRLFFFCKDNIFFYFVYFVYCILYVRRNILYYVGGYFDCEYYVFWKCCWFYNYGFVVLYRCLFFIYCFRDMGNCVYVESYK